MMKLYVPAMVLLGCVCAKVAAAPVVPLKDLPLYWGIGYSWVDATDVATATDIELEGIMGRFGYQFTKAISSELRYSQGARTGHVNGVDAKLEQVYGIYAKVNLLTDIDFTPYAIVGYSQGKVAAGTAVFDEQGVSYGIGVDFCRDHPVCMNAEYVSYVEEDIIELSAVSVGLRFNF